jgi:two-component system chemotaxis response regulator CheB
VSRAIVAIGASAGGLRAFQVLLSEIVPRPSMPIILVQHRHERSDLLMETLAHRSRAPIREPEDKEPVTPGAVYLAPAGYHLLVDGFEFALSVDPPVRHSRPSIDVLFNSVADAYADGALGIVLTGANADGAAGLKRIVQRGGRAIVQDPAESEVPVMPKAAREAVPEADVMGLAEIARYLRTDTGGGSTGR